MRNPVNLLFYWAESAERNDVGKIKLKEVERLYNLLKDNDFEVIDKRTHKKMDAIKELKGKNLVCWCAPKPCHGNFLIQFVNAEEHNGKSCDN